MQRRPDPNGIKDGRANLENMLGSDSLELATESVGLSPKERVIVRNYIKADGNKSATARLSGFSGTTINNVIQNPKVQKALLKSFEILGLDTFMIGRTLRRIMTRSGDYHYDTNKLKAIDILCRLIGVYAPKRMEVYGDVAVSNKVELKATLIKMVKVLKDSSDEKEILPIETNIRKAD